MTYKTLMVQLQPGRSHAGLLRITVDLAEQFAATVIGVAACRPLDPSYGDSYLSGGALQADFDEMEKEIKDAEAEFKAAMGSRIRTLGWRKSITYSPPCDYVATQARNADLLIIGAMPSDFLMESRVMSLSDLVMQAGRPVLIVPEGRASLNLNRVLVAWKDTPEARRAVSDALPMLSKAVDVTIVELVSKGHLEGAEARLGDVVSWLARHGVSATAVVVPSSGDDARDLERYALELGTDLIVAGAYGHSRLREWALGGVTRDLLLGSEMCSLVSH